MASGLRGTHCNEHGWSLTFVNLDETRKEMCP